MVINNIQIEQFIWILTNFCKATFDVSMQIVANNMNPKSKRILSEIINGIDQDLRRLRDFDIFETET